MTTIPVLGNGDIFSAADAVAMMAQTGCDGVVVGRGCLGRPWLFAELAAALRGEPLPTPPNLGEVGAIMSRHGVLLAEHHGEERGLRDLRKTWPGTSWASRSAATCAQLRRRVHRRRTRRPDPQLDPDVPFPTADAGGPRGRQGLAGQRYRCPTAGSTTHRTPRSPRD